MCQISKLSFLFSLRTLASRPTRTHPQGSFILTLNLQDWNRSCTEGEGETRRRRRTRICFVFVFTWNACEDREQGERRFSLPLLTVAQFIRNRPCKKRPIWLHLLSGRAGKGEVRGKQAKSRRGFLCLSLIGTWERRICRGWETTFVSWISW